MWLGSISPENTQTKGNPKTSDTSTDYTPRIIFILAAIIGLGIILALRFKGKIQKITSFVLAFVLLASAVTGFIVYPAKGDTRTDIELGDTRADIKLGDTQTDSESFEISKVLSIGGINYGIKAKVEYDMIDSGNDGDNDNPSITVLTSFPSGTVTDSIVDVTYVATASKNAIITEVSYSINGGGEEIIYLLGGNGITPKGTLGTGRVFLMPDEDNHIVFIAKDSSGKTATFNVVNTPNFDSGFSTIPKYDNNYIDFMSDGSGRRYIVNEIIAIAKDGISDEQVINAMKDISGIVIGKMNIVDKYYIEVPKSTDSELEAMCDYISARYSDLFEVVYLDIIDNAVVDSVKYTNDPWWDDWNILRWYNNQWGLTAIDIPNAWLVDSSESENRNIKVGIVDNGFRITHEDLNIPEKNVFNRNLGDDNHGTHVMGTIGAIHDNGKGLAGVVDINRNNLLGYDAFCYDNGDGIGRNTSSEEQLAGLVWTVTRGAKVINFSIGVMSEESAETYNMKYAPAVRKLISHGYDFVIVNSAGNGWDHDNNESTPDIPFDAKQNGLWAGMTDVDMVSRILVVGATDRNGNMALSYNYGRRIDVLAPGVRIYSSIATSDSAYTSYNGTSTAAPHVTGVAAMVWSANPGLSGTQIKAIIVDSARNYGHEVIDRRTEVPQSDRLTYYQVNALAAILTALKTTPTFTTGLLAGRVITIQECNSAEVAVENAHISLYSETDNSLVDLTVSDDEGYYTMYGITPGRYYLAVSAEGYVEERVPMEIEVGVNTNLHSLERLKEINYDFIIPVTRQRCVPSEYTAIFTAQDLDDIREDMSGKYILMNDIDLQDWGDWRPLGIINSSSVRTFTGTLDGNGYSIRNLTISGDSYVCNGLFSYLGNNAVIRNLGMEQTNINVSFSDLSNFSFDQCFAGSIAGNISFRGNF